MYSYYTLATRIRYYGQLPRSVKRGWESVYDAAGKSVRREIVLGEMDFTEEKGSVFDVDGEPRGFVSDVIASPSDEALDLSRRKEPVHEVLANLILDAGSLYGFTRQWGFLDGAVDAKNCRFRTRPEDIKPYQDFLRRAWRNEGDAIEDIAKDVTARIDVTPSGIEIAVLDLWNLVRFLLSRDHGAGRLKVCANPDCSSPYFLQQRRGQKFCTHKCAVLMNVRRFREREAKARFQSKRRAQR